MAGTIGMQNNTGLKMFSIFDFSSRLLISSVLFYSSLEHMLNPFAFLQDITLYRISGMNVSFLVAYFLPFLQFSTACFLLLNWKSHAARICCSVMFFCFLVVQSSAYFRGLDISCGCFGDYSSTISMPTILMVFTLFALSTISYLLLRKVLTRRFLELP